jgi:alpha-L-arabinofuranosidase
MLEDGQIIAGQDSIYASAVIDKKTKELIIKVINASSSTSSREINIAGGKKLEAKGRLILLQNQDLNAVNTFNNAVNVSPKEQSLTVKSNRLSLQLKPYSFSVIRIKMKS